MLHFGHRKSLVMGPFARQVLGVQVACHRRRLHFEEALEAILRGQPRVVGLGVFHVSDVLGYEAVGAAQQREGVLLFRAGGENDALGRRSALGRHRHGHRRIAPRPAQELDGVPGLPVDLIHLDQPHDRIVEARKDGAIGSLKRHRRCPASFSRASSSAMQMGSVMHVTEVITKSGTGVPGRRPRPPLQDAPPPKPPRNRA